MLGHDEAAVGGHLDYRIAGGREVHALPVEQRVSPRRLGPAFVDVTGDDARGDPVPVVGRPAVLEHQRRVRQRRVRRSTGHHDVGLPAKRFDDRRRSDVGVRRLDALPDRGKRLSGLHVAQLVAGGQQLVQPVHQVVAGHHRHAQRSRGGNPVEGLEQRPPAALRVDAARVAYHPHVPSDQVRCETGDQRHEVARVAERRISLPLFLQDRHGDLGQIVEHQVVDRAMADLQLRRFLPVAPESLTGGDPHDPLAHRALPGFPLMRHPAA